MCVVVCVVCVVCGGVVYGVWRCVAYGVWRCVEVWVRSTYDSESVDHAHVELFGVAEGGHFLEALDPCFLGMVVLGTADVVLLVFEHAKLASLLGLLSLQVHSPVRTMLETRHSHSNSNS